TTNLGELAMNQWQANIYTSTFFDANGNGVRDSNETGLTLVPTNIRFRDGSYSNFNNTDLPATAASTEISRLFTCKLIETNRAAPATSTAPSSCTISPTTGATSCTATRSTGRIDPPWVVSEGWQGFSGQNSFLEFGKAPFQAGENGGIYGEVIYASTRPFDDP